MIPFDVVGALRDHLAADRRPSDGLLHCSSDLRGSLRHAQLALAGAPQKQSGLVSDVRLMTGTLWHTYMNEVIQSKGWPVMQEVRLKDYLPTGWGGTADWLFWSTEHRGFVLGDLKTTKGEGMQYVLRDGAKEEHRWQTSAYFWALVNGGFPMVKGLAVMYLPMNDVSGENIEPEIIDFSPIPRDEVWGLMEARWELTQAYLDSMWVGEQHFPELPPNYLQDNLADPIGRVQKVYWNKDRWELKLVPHWTAQFCPYELDLCSCSAEGSTKIGEYTLAEWHTRPLYVPRKGYEDIEPLEEPSPSEFRKRSKWSTQVAAPEAQAA